MALTVRRAQNGDIPKIMELLVQVNMVHHTARPDIFKGPTTKYTEAQLEEIIANDSTPVFVCTDSSGDVLGHAFCIIHEVSNDRLLADIKTLYIDDICVDENARGMHVGRTIYKYVKEYAQDEKFYNITLNVWSCNESAMKFYEALGLKPQKVGMEFIL